MLCVETPISIRVPTIARASFTDKVFLAQVDAVGIGRPPRYRPGR